MHNRPRNARLASAVATLLSLGALPPAQAAKPALDIPAQPLADALSALSLQSGTPLLYEGDLAKNVRSPAVKGDYTADAALDKMLAGTGLGHRRADNGAIMLAQAQAQASAKPAPPLAKNEESAADLPTVTVVGKTARAPDDPRNQDYAATNAGTAMKTGTPIMETPFSVQVVPKEVIRDQQVYSVDKAVQNVAGVINMPANAGQHDSFMIRGFQNDTLYRDGFLLPSVLGGGTTKRDPANVERFEVLKGPGSVMFGRTEPGGVINLVTKKPQAAPYYSLQQQFGSYDFYRTTLDATGPASSDGSLLYRANLAYQNNGSFRDFVNNERVFFAPVLTWNISPATQASLEVEYLHFNENGDPGIPPIGDRPAPVRRSLFVGEPGHNSNTGDRTLVGFNWTHAFNADWTLMHRFTTEFLDYNTRGLFFYPGADADGTLARNFNDGVGSSSQHYYNTLNLTGKFATGPVKHTLLLGYDFYQLDDKLDNPCCAAAPAFNIFSPRYAGGPQRQDIFNDPNVAVYRFDFTQTWNGLYLQDQMELHKGIFLTGGMRWDSAQVYNNTTDQMTSDDSRVNPRVGLLFRPVQWLSMYANYSQNFGPSNSFFSTGGAKLGPQTADQWELGAKTEFFDGRMNATVAWFGLTKNNMSVPDPLNPTLNKTIGQAETKGLEFETQGEILPGWRLIGAYAYLPYAQITKDVDYGGGPGNTGNRLFLAPEHSGSLWTTYEFQTGELQGLKFGTGMVGVGQRQGDAANDYQLPGYVTMNLMLGYGMKVGPAKMTAQLNIDNLIDKTYYSGSNSAYQIQFGAPRTFLGSLRVEY